MKTALVLIDIQNDYFKNGRNELVGSEEACEKAFEILSYFRKNNLPVFHVRHTSLYSGATFFLPETYGAEIHEKLKPQENEIVIEKHFPDSFHETELKPKLDEKEIDHLVVCGMMTHMCVDTTVRAAKNFGYKVTLIEDACATKNLMHGNVEIPADVVQSAFMASLNKMFADVKTANEFMEKENG